MAVGASAQTQRGVAYRYNGKQKRTPLGNVTITYSGGQRSALSGQEDGAFSLMLPGLKMGDRIGLVTVKKREMMVFNQHAVDEWSVRKEPLMLILCNADEFEKQKENLIAIGRREAKKKYDRQKAELEAKLNASEIQRTEYEAALDKAYEELDRLNKNIGEYADVFARIDESEVDTLAQQALDLFNQGETERAIRLFEQGNYMEKLEKAIRTSQQADQLKAVAEQAKEQASQDSLQALQSLKAQIEAYKMNNDWEKAGELLKGLADRLKTVDDTWNYANFCFNQNKYQEVELYFLRALALLEDRQDKESLDYQQQKGSLLNNLALLYFYSQRITESEAMYKEALEISQRLAEVIPHAYESDVARTMNNLANLYSDTQRFTESEMMYKEVLKIRRRLAIENPGLYDSSVALVLNDLAILYSNTQRFSESEVVYKEALEIRRRLAAANPQAYEPDVAATLNNLAILYKGTNRFSDSEAMYKEALEIRRRLAAANPQAYEQDLAQSLRNYGLLKISLRDYTEAISPFEEALVINRRLALRNPQRQTYYENCMYWLSQLYSYNDNYMAAYEINKELLPFMREQYNSAPYSNRDDYVKVLRNLSWYSTLLRKYEESEEYARVCLKYDTSSGKTISCLAAALLFQGKYAEAEQIYRQYKDELKDSFLDDFKQLAEAGVIPKEYEADVEKIKKMLME